MVKAMELSWDAYERYAWGYGKGLRAGGLAPGGGGKADVGWECPGI